MLKGISSLISPELLKALAEMGHGDEIVFADAHFPAHSFKTMVIRLDGVGIPPLLEGVLKLFELDAYVPDPLVMMAAEPGDSLDENVLKRYRAAIEKVEPQAPKTGFISRFAFYDRAKLAYCIVVTGETAKYGNIILKKGVTPQPL
ncbi:MAG: L-fucose mutarotase [Victivallaceae bacterium]